ncbi:MAG: hypothetical protein CR996_00965 [Draconibacterium sp.]|nr:MAG: hypothetical protein CR996_00965 [Draconibacterium sp.]PIF06267.1 MAG: hypothetical protein CSA36_02440 [Draconibacterium sp.]
MKWLLVIASGVIVLSSCIQKRADKNIESEYAGSESCRQCHQRFYELWSPSHHGKAMQPVDAGFVGSSGIPGSDFFALEGKKYRIDIGNSSITMVETDGDTEKQYDVVWALGGKNVYYFLTPMEKGKLQTIPLAYDVNRRMWYNNPESAVRHFPSGTPDEALSWKDRMYTFNTSCYSCHVSQLSNNFDLATDSYNSEWKEPGINCETCHGPSAEHIKAALEAERKNKPLHDLKIIITGTFTSAQHNSSCAPCHAKMNPITSSFMPGDRYFDHFDLTGLENSDFYPDGRDLGENYTYTGWMMNKCNQSGQLHCVVCHTSSGRNRFKDNPNDACKKCHEDKVVNVVEHSGHKAGSIGSVCVNCHMPKTEFGKMVRSDHSFRPPMPEATIMFGSPNACNLCHTDKSPEWANRIVKARENGNYQEETLRWAGVLNEVRSGNWKNLDKVLDYIREEKLNELVIASFIRLLNATSDEHKWPVLIGALKSESPIVRSSAASGLMENTSDEAKRALLEACNDDFRLVRIAAAASLAAFQPGGFTESEKQLLAKATEEYMNSIVTRPDDWSSHYNLGIFYQNQGDVEKALDAYEKSAKLYPEALIPLINSSVLYSYIGNVVKAEENLKKVVAIDPDNEAANLNLGLLLAEQGKTDEAAVALKKVLEANPKQAVAAYNLSVISAKKSINDAIRYAKSAMEANPEEPKYAYTLAFYQYQDNRKAEAIKTLKSIVKKHPEYITATGFLADIYLRDNNIQQAISVYENALKSEKLSAQDRVGVEQMLTALKSSRQ